MYPAALLRYEDVPAWVLSSFAKPSRVTRFSESSGCPELPFCLGCLCFWPPAKRTKSFLNLTIFHVWYLSQAMNMGTLSPRFVKLHTAEDSASEQHRVHFYACLLKELLRANTNAGRK